jgi:phosphate transport system substrate-binding protein
MRHENWRWIAHTAMALAVAGAGCQDCQADIKGPPGDPFTTDNYPLVDGSTSLLPLARVIACELFGLSYESVAGIGDEGISEIVPDPYGTREQEISAWIMKNIVHNKTHQAYLNLVDGTVDLILVANPPSPEEATYAAAAGVTLDQREIGLDALVMLVNQINPVSTLTDDQIRAIFLGQITSWSDVTTFFGGITPFVRPVNSGSQQLMDAIVMRGETTPGWPEQVQNGVQLRSYGTMGGLVTGVTVDTSALGYSVYYYVTHQYPPGGFHLVAVNGVWPTALTISTRLYPFTAPIWVIVRTDLDPASTAYRMRDWLLTPDGQEVVARSGYVKLSL